MTGSTCARGQDIERALLALFEAMHRYDALTLHPMPSPDLVTRRVDLRSASITPALRRCCRTVGFLPDCGLSSAPGHLRTNGRKLPAPSSHAAMKIAALKRDLTARIDDFAATLSAVPLLAHDALQVDLRIYRTTDGEGLWLAIDGVALCGGPETPEAYARRVADHIAALSAFAPEPAAPWPADWSFFLVQNHLVRAPGPGWAVVKLRAMIQRQALSPERLRSLMAQPDPVVMRIEPEDAVHTEILQAQAAMVRSTSGVVLYPPEHHRRCSARIP